MLIFYFFFAHIHFAHSSHLLSLHNFGTFVMKPCTIQLALLFPKQQKTFARLFSQRFHFICMQTPLKWMSLDVEIQYDA